MLGRINSNGLQASRAIRKLIPYEPLSQVGEDILYKKMNLIVAIGYVMRPPVGFDSRLSRLPRLMLTRSTLIVAQGKGFDLRTVV